MPIKEMLSMGTFTEPAVNLNFSVGQGGDNGIADVMLIQAMFHFLASTYKTPLTALGFSTGELSRIDGICGNKTKKSILKFQIKHRDKILSADGLIEPAKYQGRNLTPGGPKGKYMTMTWLHFLSSQQALYTTEPSYIKGLISIEPRLAPWLV